MITKSAYGRSTFKLFRKVQNDFDFLVRDIDRQPVTLPGELVFHVWDDTGVSLISHPLVVVNPTRGHYRLSIPAVETLNIRSGIYMWSVTNENSAITKLLYTNQDYGSQGILEVSEGVITPVDDPYIVEAGAMTQLSGELYSSALPGSIRVNNLTGNHTVLAHLNEFTGTLKILASMDEQPPTDETGWVEVETTDWTNHTGTPAVNFYGNFTYVKFVITDANGFTKLVYRN